MKYRNPVVSILVITLLLAACSQLPTADSPGTGIQLEQYLAKNDYEGAHQWLDGQARKGADTTANKRLLEQHIHAFEQSTLTQLTRLEKEGNWNEALDQLNTALDKLPHSAVLLAERKRALSLRDPALQRNIESELLIRANYLRQSMEILQDRQKIRSPTLTESVHKTRLRLEQHELSTLLLSCATNAISREDYVNAEKCLRAAKAGGDPEKIQALREELARAQLDGGVDPDIQRKRLVQKQQAAQQYRQQLHAALARGELAQARAIIHELMKLEGHTPELTALRNAVEAAISARVAELHDTANAYYRDSEIVLAREQWVEILRLEPGNEQARDNINRANRVLKNLETLQQDNGTASTPVPAAGPVN